LRRSKGQRKSSTHVRDGALNFLFGQRPVIIEIGDHFPHERLGEFDRAVLIAEVILENCQRQLLRARAFISPFESPLGELLDVVMLAEPMAIDGDLKTVDISCSLIGLHGT
jgi:hypothetical protein